MYRKLPKANRKSQKLFPLSKIAHPFHFITYMVNVLKFQALYSILSKFCYFMKTLLEILSGMANSVDPDQTAVGLHCLHIPFYQTLWCRKC